MSGNSWNGKSGVGTGSGAGSETEPGIIGIFLNANIPPVCCCCTGGLYSFRTPLSSKKSASNGAVLAKFILPEPVEED